MEKKKSKEDNKDAGKNGFTVAVLCLHCFESWAMIIQPRTNVFKLPCEKCGVSDSFTTFIPKQFFGDAKELH